MLVFRCLVKTIQQPYHITEDAYRIIRSIFRIRSFDFIKVHEHEEHFQAITKENVIDYLSFSVQVDGGWFLTIFYDFSMFVLAEYNLIDS